MGLVFNRLLSDSAKAGTIPANETAGFKAAFEALAAKYQIDVEAMALGILNGKHLNPTMNNFLRQKK